MSNSRNLKRRGVHKLYKNSGEIKKVFIPHTTIIGTNKDPKTLKVKNDLIVTGSAYISGTLNVYSGSNFTYNTLTIESWISRPGSKSKQQFLLPFLTYLLRHLYI